MRKQNAMSLAQWSSKVASGPMPKPAPKVKKTFDDLEFKTHANPYHVGAKQARMTFANGWGVSVVQSGGSGGIGGLYGSAEDGTYELAVLGVDGNVNSVNPIGKGDVCGWLSPEEVTIAMDAIQSFLRVDSASPPLSWRKQWDWKYRADHGDEE